MKRAAVFAITILMTGVIFSQGVHIRENATIAPGQARKVQGESTHTIRYEFYWSGGDSASVQWNCYCLPALNTVASVTSPIIIDIESAVASTYAFEPLMMYSRLMENRDKWEAIYVSFKLFYDGTPIDSGYDGAWPDGEWYSSTGGSASGYSYGRCCPAPWPLFQTPYSAFSISLSPGITWLPIYCGGSALMNLTPLFDCSSPWIPWLTSDPMTLTVVSGRQYASLHIFESGTGNDLKLGDTVATTGDEFWRYFIEADSVEPDSIGEWVVVQAESDGLTSKDSIQISPTPVAITFSPPRVPPGDTANIIAKQRNADGTLTDYPQGQLFEVQIDSGGSYGTILSSTGDTAGYFQSIPLPFQFIAVDSIPADSENVRVKIGPAVILPSSVAPGEKGSGNGNGVLSKVPKLLSTPNKLMNANVKSPPVKSSSSIKAYGDRKSPSFLSGSYGNDFGTGWVEIENVKIKVTAAASTLTPLGDADNTGPQNARVIDWKKRKTDQVTVAVTDINNNPVPNYPFTLSAFVRPNSGGHDHNTNRPTGKFIHKADTVATFQDKTNSDGKAIYTYICSGFGGVDSIFVKGKTDRDTSSTTILLQFPGLEELTSGDHYGLIGAHSQGATSEHEKNHYGMEDLVSELKTLADTIYVQKGYELQINDMSLVNGGPFDITNNWNCPHQTHRNGISADIRNSLTNGTREIHFSKKELADWITSTGLDEGDDFKVGIEAGHYHVTIY